MAHPATSGVEVTKSINLRVDGSERNREWNVRTSWKYVLNDRTLAV